VRVFHTDSFVLPLPEDHRFPMAKYARLRERVVCELDEVVDLQLPPAASDAELARVHDPGYLERVRTGTLGREHVRRIGFPWSPAMVERSRRSTGATLAAARAALADGVGVSLAGGTHHAFRDRGEGFCVFNDSVVAARVLLDEGAVARVVVVDCDVHQGNGTAALCAGDDAVFTLSIHGARNFPYRKERSDLDVALEDGTGDTAYLEALDRALDRSFARGVPDLAIYVSGADPWQGDRWGRLGLTKRGLAERDRRVLGACRDRGVAVAVTMAGGYAPHVEDIVDIHAETVRAAAETIGA